LSIVTIFCFEAVRQYFIFLYRLDYYHHLMERTPWTSSLRRGQLVAVPDGLDDPAAATSYTNPLTAWALTRSSHNLKEGDWLLQTAAASSVGKLVLQLAQRFRFKTINVIRRREQETIIRNLGGNEVICTADEKSQGTPAGIDRGQGR
jgi:NADPH2:quinone reductase